jgi:hypothetical protein
MGPRLSIIKAYTTLLQMQSHSLGMTSVSIKLLRVMKVKSSKWSQRQNWMAVSKHLCQLEIYTNKLEDLNLVFANHGEEYEIYPLTIIEISKAQQKDQQFKVHYK